MATVCVGCGLEVVGGLLQVQEGGVAGEADLGIVCRDDHLDWTLPMIARQTTTTLPYTTATSVATGLVNLAAITNNSFGPIYGYGDGVFTIEADGSVTVQEDGIYYMSLTGAPIKRADETDKMTGGRARIYQGGTILASSAAVTYSPEVDMSPTTGDPSSAGDGPEFNCSVVWPLMAGDGITWEVNGQTDVVGVTVKFPGEANIFTMTRLGAIR
jgi:hypothetical protein